MNLNQFDLIAQYLILQPKNTKYLKHLEDNGRQKRCNKLIKSDSKGICNVTKHLNFK